MSNEPYCFSEDYELAVTVLTISGPKDLMQIAYGTKEPRCVIEKAIEEIVAGGGIWEDAITFYPIAAIIGYRLVEMDESGKTLMRKIREDTKNEEERLEKVKPKVVTEPLPLNVKKPSLLSRLTGKP